jgi:hypothetical protein
MNDKGQRISGREALTAFPRNAVGYVSSDGNQTFNLTSRWSW